MINNKYIVMVFIIIGLNGQDKGQELFKEKKYDDARKYYESILEQRNDDKAAFFGLGASSYYQNDFDAALNSFGNSLDTDNKELRSKSYYNIGRVLQEKKELEKSLAFYRKSLELNPNDIDTKINYELLKRQINQDQKKNSNQNEDNSDGKNEENQKNQDQSNDGNEKNKQQDQSQSEEKDETQKEKDQKEDIAEDKSNSQDEEKENNRNKKEEELSPEDKENKSDQLMQAEAILNALKDQEKINQKQKISKTKSYKFDKDW